MERSISAPIILPDAELDRLGEIYLANPRLRARGVLFEAFILRAGVLVDEDAVRREGLLPAQRTAQQRADRDGALRELAERSFAAAERESTFGSNGRLVERLKHRAHPPNHPRKRIAKAA